MAKDKKKRRIEQNIKKLSAGSVKTKKTISNKQSKPSAQRVGPGGPNGLPFSRHDRILLVGEGDFSFARSLVLHHHCTNVLATSLDTEAELLRKYPQARDHISKLQESGQKILYGVDATKPSQKAIRKPPFPSVPSSQDGTSDLRHHNANDEDGDAQRSGSSEFGGFSDDDDAKIRVSSDSTPAILGPRGWDVIIFNFPHTGGLSTDVNRQTRHNQSLLVSFFTSCLPLLTPVCESHPSGGVVLVTLFEGEPYTLWNIRDLGRHAGFKVERSWRFRWDLYDSYRHARTLGNVEGKGGAWRGEERVARTYAFVPKDAPERTFEFDGAAARSKSNKKGKRKRQSDGEIATDDDDDDSDDD